MSPNEPRKLSAAHRAAISASLKGKLKGRKLSAETRAKMSAAQKGVPKNEKWLATRIGRPLSEAHRESIKRGMRASWEKKRQATQ